jgi:hypothetical protein
LEPGVGQLQQGLGAAALAGQKKPMGHVTLAAPPAQKDPAAHAAHALGPLELPARDVVPAAHGAHVEPAR